MVRGEVPEGYQPVIRVYGVEESASFARTLLIEALERTGIKVEAPRPELARLGQRHARLAW